MGFNWGAFGQGLSQGLNEELVGNALNQGYAQHKQTEAEDAAKKAYDEGLQKLNSQYDRPMMELGDAERDKIMANSGDPVLRVEGAPDTKAAQPAQAIPVGEVNKSKPYQPDAAAGQPGTTTGQPMSQAEYERQYRALTNTYNNAKAQARIDYYRRRGDDETAAKYEDELKNTQWHQGMVEQYYGIQSGDAKAMKPLIGYLNATMGNGTQIVQNPNGGMSLLGADGQVLQQDFKPSGAQINEAFQNYYNAAKFFQNGGFDKALERAKLIADSRRADRAQDFAEWQGKDASARGWSADKRADRAQEFAEWQGKDASARGWSADKRADRAQDFTEWQGKDASARGWRADKRADEAQALNVWQVNDASARAWRADERAERAQDFAEWQGKDASAREWRKLNHKSTSYKSFTNPETGLREEYVADEKTGNPLFSVGPDGSPRPYYMTDEEFNAAGRQIIKEGFTPNMVYDPRYERYELAATKEENGNTFVRLNGTDEWVNVNDIPNPYQDTDPPQAIPAAQSSSAPQDKQAIPADKPASSTQAKAPPQSGKTTSTAQTPAKQSAERRAIPEKQAAKREEPGVLGEFGRWTATALGTDKEVPLVNEDSVYAKVGKAVSKGLSAKGREAIDTSKAKAERSYKRVTGKARNVKMKEILERTKKAFSDSQESVSHREKGVEAREKDKARKNGDKK